MIHNRTYREAVRDSLEESDRRRNRFAAVPQEEMGFALSLFVGAASGTLTITQSGDLRGASRRECSRIVSVLARNGQKMRADSIRSEYTETLDGAFRALWRHYDADQQQASVCARVLGFYLLMEETGGGLVDGWVSSSEDGDEVVVLHPAVVATLACVVLSAEGRVSRTAFRTQLEACAV